MTAPAAAAGKVRVRVRRLPPADPLPAGGDPRLEPSASTGAVPWRFAVACAAVAVLGGSIGDVFVGAALLGAALGVWAGAGAVLAAAATVTRWGTADLGIVAGDQAVLGAAVAVGPGLGAASSLLAALAIALGATAAPESLDRRLVALAAGAGAGVLAAGPAPSSPADAAMRAGGLLAAVALAWFAAGPWARRRVPAWAAAAAGGAAVVAAVVA